MIAFVRPLFGDVGANLFLKVITCSNGAPTYRHTDSGCQDDDRCGEDDPIGRNCARLVGEKVFKLVSHLSSDTY